MPVKLRLKHSATANKAPLPADLLEGELALNINSASPAAYIKDSTGVIRKIAGITVGSTTPATPTAGMAWLDTTVPTKPVFKVHDGTAWQGAGSGVSTGVTAPTSPAAGDLWVDTTVPTAPVVNIWNGTAFVPVVPAAVAVADASETVKGIVELATAAETTTGTDATRAVHPAGLKVELDKKATKTVTSDTAPTNPKDGDLWYDSVSGELYVWYDSDDAGAVAGTWVQANPQPTKYSTITLGTAVTASTTAVDFTGIPSWVKRVTVMFDGVSSSGTSTRLLQLGDSGGVETTGYVGNAFGSSTSALLGALAGVTTGIPFQSTTGAADSSRGQITLSNLSGGTWVAHGCSVRTDNSIFVNGGSKTLSGTLDRIRITTVNGTDTFDAGSINISYEF